MPNDYSIDLSKYRLEQAREMLRVAQLNLDIKGYKSCNNRAYYAIFHAINAVHAIKGFASRKHSGIISEFNRKYINTGIFEKACSKIITTASLIRNVSDYEDFYITSREEAETQLKNAKIFYEYVEKYLSDVYAKVVIKPDN